MKRELSPTSGVGRGGAAVPGSADPRAHVAKVPRLEDPDLARWTVRRAHASASIARATPEEHPRAHRARWRPRSPPYPLSPTTTSAQMAARVTLCHSAAAAERASGVAVDERGPARVVRVAVEARSEPSRRSRSQARKPRSRGRPSRRSRRRPSSPRARPSVSGSLRPSRLAPRLRPWTRSRPARNRRARTMLPRRPRRTKRRSATDEARTGDGRGRGGQRATRRRFEHHARSG